VFTVTPDVSGGRTVAYDRDPDYCPTCHTGVSPTLLCPSGNFVTEPQILEIAYRCTRRACQRMLIGVFRKKTFDGPFLLTEVLPVTPKQVDLPQTVRQLSPSFAVIYSQAIAAEGHRLHEIVGVALRRALEFLVKDYCIYLHPQKKQAIERGFLGTCITENVSDPRVKSCAERAAWLANDQAHYRRDWTDFDIRDLKTLIQLTLNFVDSDLIAREYEAGMVSRKATPTKEVP